MIRVLLVDDHAVVRMGFRLLLQSNPDITVVAEADSGESACQFFLELAPDVVVMDVYLGGTRAGIEAARWLREVCGVPVVFVTAHSDDGTLERIRSVLPGAPVLSKPVYRENLAHAISAAIH